MIRKFEEYLIYFNVYSVMGWLYEVIIILIVFIADIVCKFVIM